MKLVSLGALCFVVGFGLAVTLANTVLAPLQPIRFDMDDDRKLSVIELRSALSAVFKLADTDSDGRITRQEGKALARESADGLPAMIAATIRFERFDANKDGVVTLDEIRSPRDFRRVFDEFDRNSDSHLDSKELEDNGLGVVLIRD